MFIGAIVALDNKNGIGYDNKLAWKLKEAYRNMYLYKIRGQNESLL